jgi:dTDP-4-dehydrorhamnose reductase
MRGSVLFVGGDSEIATATTAHLRSLGCGVVATTRRRAHVDRPFLDLAQMTADWPIPDGIRAACFCAAVARLGDCAKDPAATSRVNVTATTALADRLLARGIPLVFLSTDKVFDGSLAQVPADTPQCPVSEYGRQKAATEAALSERMRAGAPAAILRLSKVVSPGLDLFRQWIINFNNGKSVRAFDDLTMAPVPMAVVTAAIEHLLREPDAGIFQLSAASDVPYSEIALHLARLVGADSDLVERASGKSVGLPPGSLPQHTTLDSSAMRERFGIAMPDAWTVIDELIAACR